MSKYFKYAIGEIILVVIGILIALQINNWNENRKNRITEADYYCRILEDFELNEKLIDENSELITHRIKLTKALIKDLNNTPNDRSTILNKFVVALRQDVSVPSNITFEDLTSSGQLKLLTDIKLKNKLIEYSTFLNNTLNLLSENRNEIVKRYTDFDLITELGYQEVEYIRKELDEEHMSFLPNINWTNDPNHPYFIKFQDNLVFILGMQLRQKQHFSNLKREIQQPIELLKDKNCN
ncbi:MAG: DUF6090 family protein [Winogradskyella sp.]|uniref:DUF6090 family protein n=1 Tax=Winogradskyella sp. TaxID=1883156 RepID=UPI00385C8FEC